MPIGEDYDKKFSGKYDGQNHTIQGLYINRSFISYIGLFEFNYRAEIKNIGLSNVNITGFNCTGGLVGGNYESTISNSNNTGSVNGVDLVGGFVGSNQESTITNCYNSGNVKGDSKVGGLAGYSLDSTINNSYNSGSVNGTDILGGLVGINSNSYVSNSYYDSETSGQEDTGKGEPKITAEMLQQSTFIGFDFTDVWGISEDNSSPYLKCQNIVVYNRAVSNLHATSFTLGKGKIFNVSDSDINITEYGYLYKRDIPPTLNDCIKTATVSGSGNFTSGSFLTVPETNLDGLDTDSTYFARIYATDGNTV